MIVSVIVGASATELYVDGAIDVSANISSQTTTGSLVFGGDSVEALNGFIAEIAVFNRALSSTERQSIETYLNGRYSAF